LIIFYFVGVTGVAGNSRFRLPIVPFCLIIGAWGITTLSDLIKKKNLAQKYDQIA
jgi:hypothetical protein